MTEEVVVAVGVDATQKATPVVQVPVGAVVPVPTPEEQADAVHEAL